MRQYTHSSNLVRHSTLIASSPTMWPWTLLLRSKRQQRAAIRVGTMTGGCRRRKIPWLVHQLVYSAVRE